MPPVGQTPRAALRAIANSWPTDPFHPNLQMGVFLKSLATHPNLKQEHVNIVQALHSGVLAKRYAPSSRTLKPASYPTMYNRLMEGIEKSQQGVGRPGWKRFLGIW
ncbi:hypothetical protein BKA62DRAFT_830050 [Auriculariales sp. MPI-PUGE-AT-0066]|nr:hypothetical protein BKA62DRAFT_830050 [Auriculariales sp. MPI-PUGE-AT-0066]